MATESWHQHLWESRYSPHECTSEDCVCDELGEPCYCGAWNPTACTCP